MNLETILTRLGIQAKKTGHKWNASCPNPDHKDKTPSWFIRDEPENERHGFHRCSSCGFAGGLVGLVSTVLNIDTKQAREWLKGHEIEKPVPKAVTVSVSLTPKGRRFTVPEGVQFAPVETWPQRAREYVLNRLASWQLERWGIGYAVDGRLEGRIVIPYRDALGVPKGYTARTYTGEVKRYMEPTDAEGADRSALFGEQYWFNDDTDDHTVIVCEGAFNALAVERALWVPGYYPAIAATAGSSLRPAHAVKLAEFARVVILTDPDRAGDKMAAALSDALGRYCELVRIRLPVGTDPDSIPREELEATLAPYVTVDENIDAPISFDFGANVH